jgi:hypothetical protein
MCRTDAAAGLAECAIGDARRIVRPDRIERTTLHTFVAADTAGFHLAFGQAQHIGGREDRARWTKTFAPETRCQNTQTENRQKQNDRNIMACIHRRDQIPPLQQSDLQRPKDEHHAARKHWNRRNKSRD